MQLSKAFYKNGMIAAKVWIAFNALIILSAMPKVLKLY